MHFVFDWWTLASFSRSWSELEMSKHKVDSLWAARVDLTPLKWDKSIGVSRQAFNAVTFRRRFVPRRLRQLHHGGLGTSQRHHLSGDGRWF
jgi:hypothetical protein